MCGTVMRGADALPGSKATSRTKGSHRNLGDLVSGRRRRVLCVYGGPHREGEEPKPMMHGHGKIRNYQPEIAMFRMAGNVSGNVPRPAAAAHALFRTGGIRQPGADGNAPAGLRPRHGRGAIVSNIERLGLCREGSWHEAARSAVRLRSPHAHRTRRTGAGVKHRTGKTFDRLHRHAFRWASLPSSLAQRGVFRSVSSSSSLRTWPGVSRSA